MRRPTLYAPHAPGVVLLAVCHHRAWFDILTAGGDQGDAELIAGPALAQLTPTERLRLRHFVERCQPVRYPRHRAWLDRVTAPVGGIGEAL